eukprot:TRINITY_DN45542_c0_g1_i1.p1 TRINITY_DN45542_c0_g1~~TRINITY_DN45542_c0_g1_i1.p1  ORF type:complete len:512 (-),score=55.23 TRINITY_DN45542_c0_g1_i1:116-1600(-)
MVPPAVVGHGRPPLSLGVPAPPPGANSLDEALYRDAEDRRRRQLHREAAAWEDAQQLRIPRLGRASRALCQGRLERELREAAEELCGDSVDIPRADLSRVLEAIGLLCGDEGEETFCAKLALLLDKEERGAVPFERLLDFLTRAADRTDLDVMERQRISGGTEVGLSLEEACFAHLDQQLSRAASGLLTNRVRRPRRASSGTRAVAASHSLAISGPGTPSASSCAASLRRSADSARGCGTSMVPASARTQRPRSAPRLRSSACGEEERVEPGMHRCHLLYHQAVFASRESAQLGEEIRSLRAQEEMRECTFKPKLTASRRPPSPSSCGTQPRNYDATVARMRAAHRRREERKEANERVPRGENYERLRRLGTQPFSCYYKDPRLARKPPIMYVDVSVGNGKSGRIGIHEGDDLRVLSRNFARTFQLDVDMERRLEEHLRQACIARERGMLVADRHEPIDYYEDYGDRPLDAYASEPGDTSVCDEVRSEDLLGGA